MTARSLKPLQFHFMKPQHLIFMLFLACLPVAAFSQIQLEGKLQVGDTSQVHTVFTTAGDRLVGRVLAFDKGTITFELKNKSQLVFQHDEIEKILVQDTAAGGTSIEYLKTDPQATTGLPFSYQIYLVNGKSYTGELLRFSKSQVRLSCEGCPSRMSTSSIKEVVSVSEPLNQMAKKPAMMHLLKTSRGDRFVGQLLKYSPGRGFSFLLENGDTLNFSEQRLQYGQLVKSDERPGKTHVWRHRLRAAQGQGGVQELDFVLPYNGYWRDRFLDPGSRCLYFYALPRRIFSGKIGLQHRQILAHRSRWDGDGHFGSIQRFRRRSK
jgi:sRNA-binding regulator protein Hfq